jgi:hypothetical protein
MWLIDWRVDSLGVLDRRLQELLGRMHTRGVGRLRRDSFALRTAKFPLLAGSLALIGGSSFSSIRSLAAGQELDPNAIGRRANSRA